MISLLHYPGILAYPLPIVNSILRRFFNFYSRIFLCRPGIAAPDFGQNQSETLVPSPGRKEDFTQMGTPKRMPNSTERS